MNRAKILAPAGDKNSFLAAVAAGADAIFCGLKIFSARMEADNFSIEELARLTELAGSKQIEVYIAFNSIIKESEITKVYNILCKLCRYVAFDALIIQDPAVIPLARKAGFEKDFHLSTLGNLTFAEGLSTARQFGFKKIVLPREFTIDEIKAMAEHLPEDTELEIFVHGALCYSISGRCYWSSWFGGKSSLRGRCVQPCRRMYQQKGARKRYFSCMDFSHDVLSKVLNQIPQVSTWKIEGRKKSPHYVYHTVKAYRLLRDDPSRKKEALAYLDYAMGREFTHYNLLSQRRANPLDHASETGSGLFVGRIKNPAEPYFITREPLLVSDLLRIGYEEDTYHAIQKVTRAIPKKGKFYLNKKTGSKIQKGAPVYLIDRRTPELIESLKILEAELSQIEQTKIRPAHENFQLPNQKKQKIKKTKPVELFLGRSKPKSAVPRSENGVWLSSRGYSVRPSPRDWLWLDPVIFPDEENICISAVTRALKKGAKRFVLNAPWQLSLFKNPNRLELWAGPYCNLTNSLSINMLESYGFKGAFVSPELDKDNFLSLPAHSKLPLGAVISGNWPLGVSRIISNELKLNQAFISPMGETAWASKHGNCYYIYPNWILDLKSQQKQMADAGYTVFAHIREAIPKGIKLKKRAGLWNWNLKLL